LAAAHGQIQLLLLLQVLSLMNLACYCLLLQVLSPMNSAGCCLLQQLALAAAAV
jgi:hypothetical protein